MTGLNAETVLTGFRQAKARRKSWETLWSECYDFALPQHDGALLNRPSGQGRGDRLFDATAADAVDQLAASLMAELTPPWSRWFELVAGVDIDDEERDAMGVALDRASAVLQTHFDRSNFGLEIHQAYLDLVTVGSASLLFEEAPSGESSAFRFTAVPIGQVALEEGESGRLDTTYRSTELSDAQLRARFPEARLPPHKAPGQKGKADDDARHTIIEAVIPDENGMRQYAAVLTDGGEEGWVIS
ncbi:MAG: phage tail protein, partial [Alphaproteobacteria bacterium]|nr:phage tail protein [Alphaproteobacteria bacterium]